MRMVFACLVAVFAVTGCGGSSGSSDAADAWPEENREAFSYACVLNAEEAGADADEAQDYCSCVLSELERRYSIDEFAEIEQEMLRGVETDLDMTELQDLCLS